MTTSETSIQVSRTVNAPAARIFALLTDPARHEEFDGSGMVRASEDAADVSREGEVFVMNMHAEVMGGDYQMHNHVTEYVEDRVIAWQPAETGKEPGGWEWRYDLDATDDRSTSVTLSYDWSKVDDPELAKTFPAVPRERLADSLNKLAALAESDTTV